MANIVDDFVISYILTKDSAVCVFEKRKISDKNKFEHPTIKPYQIIENLVFNSSNQGEVVLDPFAGSGTTLVAAKNLGRHYIGFEINPKWAEIARKRLNNEQANGQMTMFTM